MLYYRGYIDICASVGFYEGRREKDWGALLVVIVK